MRRAIDVTVAALLLALLAPVLLLVTIAVRLRLGAPVLFVQQRAGRGGAPFRLLKFRTMTDARDGSGALLPDDARLTTFGRFLRSTSLDELPQLWNVVRGDMSLVGPRPLLLDYLPLYTARQATRHTVRPGITGLAQVSGRNAVSWEEKLSLDCEYVERRSFTLDVVILYRTVLHLARREGISAAGEATASRFMGTPGR